MCHAGGEGAAGLHPVGSENCHGRPIVTPLDGLKDRSVLLNRLGGELGLGGGPDFQGAQLRPEVVEELVQPPIAGAGDELPVKRLIRPNGTNSIMVRDRVEHVAIQLSEGVDLLSLELR